MFLSLNGNWKCREAGTEQWLDAAVPGCNYLDLMQNGILPDPFLGTNEKDAYWVSEKDWEYTREFELSEQARKADKVLLVCEQLDTLCDISLNGKHIGSAQNTHLLYEFDSKPYLKVGKNSIEIRFFSPVSYVKREQKKHRCPVNNNGLTGIPLIRKPQCHFGWDWGPVLTPSGISGNIGLVTYHKARISDMKVLQTHHDNKVTLDIEA
ncbi:MAG: glycoside hydrolase family 2 protein, partial [Clostridia bacterium]|nr:glycoside hydrolase family 2 protein [Clostridia bacterium]